ncbi:MAG: type II toxin-antitoxin system VapC family toxin [Oligoflexales bacterium]|nr:type II toxin-antitoxin system VapC family toxin [Oligoflexales bacterium]
MKAIIDTCIISPFLSKRGPSEALVDWIVDLEFAAISIVTLFELEMGLKSAGLMKTINLLASLLSNYEINIVDFGQKHARIASDQGSKMKSQGYIYSLQDLWIGATAVVEGLDIATANKKDFEHWGLTLVNPL